jgi:hypothetical protein
MRTETFLNQNSSTPDKKETFPDIAKELIAMAEEDEEMVKEQQLKPTQERKWGENHQKHFNRLQEIIKEIGWPTISKVGEIASEKAWLLVQHADEHLEFQRLCLSLMQKEEKDEVSKQNIAYLTDRICVNSHQPQIYGTQYYQDENGKMLLRPIKDLKIIDQLRKEMDLDELNNDN